MVRHTMTKYSANGKKQQQFWSPWIDLRSNTPKTIWRHMPPKCELDRLFSKNVPHILEKIFLSLDCASFINCIEINKAWNELLTSEPFRIKGKALFSQDIGMELRFAAQSGQTGMVRRILSSGMVSTRELTYSTANRGSPLLQATVYGHTDVVKILLKGGANPNKTDVKSLSTPLYEACQQGYLDIVKVLLAAGANDRLKIMTYNRKKKKYLPCGIEHPNTPLLVAASFGHADVIKELLSRKVWQYENTILDQALNHAAASGHTNVVRMLLDMHSRNPNVLALYSDTFALFTATLKGHKNVVQLLLGEGADPNLVNEMGWTPLMMAAYQGDEDLVQLLIDRGADPDKVDHHGNTALSMALDNGRTDIAGILEKKMPSNINLDLMQGL